MDLLILANVEAERDTLKAENLRLASEVASRNQRALDGDQCKASWDELYDRAEAFRVERDALRAALLEVLEFQSDPKAPTIHDFGRWRRLAQPSKAGEQK